MWRKRGAGGFTDFGEGGEFERAGFEEVE